jgi:NADH-quinone oxidoreductase subunit L
VPLIGCFINGIFGRSLQAKMGKGIVHSIAIAASASTFAVALMAFFELVGNDKVIQQNLWTWFSLNGDSAAISADMSFRVDRLTSVMLLIVSGVGTLIHIFSTGYMQDEKPYWRFFAWLNLFMAMMLILVIGDNFLLMFVGWEGVGLASYLLIGYYYEEVEKAQAGMKAFLVNRVGDFAFICGMSLLFWTFVSAYGSLDAATTAQFEGASLLHFGDLSDLFRVEAFQQAVLATEVWGVPVIHLGCVLLFIGAAGKSAQIPLYVWLPDAMAGPTPVSALIHAATMVTAGVYMCVRLNFAFSLSDVAMTVVACTGAATALFAATIGFFQTDIKRVLAYSTVSQLGFMFLGVGVGAFSAGAFHLMTHAFFKACLFLGSGAIIYAMHHHQDMKDLGGLRKILPVTYWTFLISTLAIAGFPGTSGFFSKDEILWRTYDTNNLLVPGEVLWVIGVIAAACTTFYMFRLVFQTFYQKTRADEHTLEHAKEYKAMSFPLIILAMLALGTGALGLPAWTGMTNHFDNWLEPVTDQATINTQWKTDQLHEMEGAKAQLEGINAELATPLAATASPEAKHRRYRLEWAAGKLSNKINTQADVGFAAFHSHSGELVLMVITVLMALLAFIAAWKLYGTTYRDPENEAKLYGPRLYRLLLNKYFVDEIYSKYIVQPALKLMRACFWIDSKIVDGLVNLSGFIMKIVAWTIGSLDSHIVDGMVNGAADLCSAVAGKVRTLQTGRVQNYVMGAVTGAAVLIILTFMV